MSKQSEFYYTTDCGDKVYLTDVQAEEVYRQVRANHRAEDLYQTIGDSFSYNPELMALEKKDLLEFAPDVEEELEKYSDNSNYGNICETVIEDVIIPYLEEMKEVKND